MARFGGTTAVTPFGRVVVGHGFSSQHGISQNLQCYNKRARGVVGVCCGRWTRHHGSSAPGSPAGFSSLFGTGHRSVTPVSVALVCRQPKP